MYIKSFIDLEQCLDYLKSLGCKDEKVFGKLAKNSICTYKKTTIIYDPYRLLEF